MVEAVRGASRRNQWEIDETSSPATASPGRANANATCEPPPRSTHALDLRPLTASGFKDTTSLAAEVIRLKKESHAPGLDGMGRAMLVQSIAARQAEWVTMAKKEGLPAPSGPVEPFRSSPKSIENAFLWSEAGGITPRDELARDGGRAFRTSIRDAVVLRTRGFEAVVKLHEKDPEAQCGLYVTMLGLRGVKVSAADASKLDALSALYAQSLRNERTQRPSIGLDGRVGTATEIDAYERQQAIHAMSPGTTLGSLMATYSAMVTGELDVHRMRTMGNAGNDAEGMLDAEPQYGVPGRSW